MEPSLFRYIWHHTKRQQLFILMLIVCSMPIYFVVLELPKRIINGPISGEAFPTPQSTQRYFELSFTWPFGGEEAATLVLWKGLELGRIELLVVLSLAFVAFVIISGLLKFVINTYKGILGERMLRRLRYELVDMLLRFPVQRVRQERGSEVASMIKDEVEPLGGFIGDSFALPIFSIAQAITALTFILFQSFYLGLIAVGMIVVTTVTIPPLRRRLIELARQRQLAARGLSGRIGEVVEGIEDIRVNDTSYYERSDLVTRLGQIFSIRYEIYQRKFFVKFLNNFLAQMTPFLFYLIGGIFVIMDRLDIGQLVAVIAAYRDLPPPVKEIINWDQRRLDVQSKYTQVVEQFHVDEPLDPAIQPLANEDPPHLTGAVVSNHINIVANDGQELLRSVVFKFDINERVALVGDANSGVDVLAEALVGFRKPQQGSLLIGGHDVTEMPDPLRGRRIAYVSDNPYFTNDTIENTLTYSLRHSRMGGEIISTGHIHQDTVQKKQQWREAMQSGQPYFDPDTSWIDYKTAGLASPDDLDATLIKCLEIVGLDRDIYDFGLYSHITPDDEDLVFDFMSVRRDFRIMVRRNELKSLIENFRPDYYHNQSTILQNLMFGAVVKPENFNGPPEHNAEFLKILAINDCDKSLFALGVEIIKILVGLLGGVTTNLGLLHRLNLIDEEELSLYTKLLKAQRNLQWETASDDIKKAFYAPAFRYREPRHRFGVLTRDFRRQIVQTRKNLRLKSPQHIREAIQFYNPNRFNHSENIGSNLIFGRLNSQKIEVEQNITNRLYKILDENDLLQTLIKVGLMRQVGNGGQDLTTIQRQRLNLARALIKKPDMIVINKALSNLDYDSFEKTSNDFFKAYEGGVIWSLPSDDLAQNFDRILYFDDGRLIDEHVNSSRRPNHLSSVKLQN